MVGIVTNLRGKSVIGSVIGVAAPLLTLIKVTYYPL